MLARLLTAARGLDWGFRAEMIYGVDGNEAQSFGNNLVASTSAQTGTMAFTNGLCLSCMRKLQWATCP